MDELVKTLAEVIKKSQNIVFFGGAGVSTESGIPDFRSPAGLYNVKIKVPSLTNTSYCAEEILSHHFFVNNTKLFYDYYFNALFYPNALPNDAHKFLTKLEKMGKLKAIITQNIDGLHQMAGSVNVLELHGSIKRNYCLKCHHFLDDEEMVKYHANCPVCGGLMKPDVVLYEEALDSDVIEKSIDAILKADCLIIGGTSLTVYPAASFVRYFRGRHLIVINKQKTEMDQYAFLTINDAIGKVFKEVSEILDK